MGSLSLRASLGRAKQQQQSSVEDRTHREAQQPLLEAETVQPTIREHPQLCDQQLTLQQQQQQQQPQQQVSVNEKLMSNRQNPRNTVQLHRGRGRGRGAARGCTTSSRGEGRKGKPIPAGETKTGQRKITSMLTRSTRGTFGTKESESGRPPPGESTAGQETHRGQ